MWWDINQPLSYNALFNFIVGNRGGGKTYGSKCWAVRDYLKTGAQFVYMRRYKTEFKNNENFFTAVQPEFPNNELSTHRDGNYYIDGNLAGFKIPLSIASSVKSNEYPHVNKIIFDEFLIDKGSYHYLTDEVVKFLDAYETIARMRDVRVFFLANAISAVNPYFTYFKLYLPYKSTISRRDDMLVQLVQNQDYIDAKKQTRFGQIIADTPYGNYSIENQFLRDDPAFIMKKPANSHFCFKIAYMGTEYGVWQNMKVGLMFISPDIDPDCYYTLAATTTDHKPNYLLLKSKHQFPTYTALVKAWRIGLVRFENQRCKAMWEEIQRMAL